jgi:hypothetical protein
MIESLSRWFKGDDDAILFAQTLWDAIQQWDDIEDEGRCENTNALLSWLAFGKEYAAFFHANAHILRPALLVMYLQWRAANVLDHGSAGDVAKSYMLRAGVYSVWHVMAWIIGGDDWAAEVGPEIYRSYGETPAELLREMQCQTP